MKKGSFGRYYLLCCAGVLAAACYPLSMGIRVISEMLANGTVQKENYPKYVIPYTPISVAIIVGVLLMPLLLRRLKKYALAGGAAAGAGVFFALEALLEKKVVVSSADAVASLEDWQMFMCAVPSPEWVAAASTYRTHTPVEILMGEYDPAFKLHFYIISLVLIVTILNGLYGFGQLIRSGERKRLGALVTQSVCSAVFLGLCILACFTAFWRDGNIRVSPLSAALMSVFFILFGATVGVFIGSFLLGKRKAVSVLIPSAAASLMTLLMYTGELILLNGHLYSFGESGIFTGIPGIVLSPFDVFIVAASGCITALMLCLLNNSRTESRR